MLHDVCSAIHPLAVGSPAFREIAESDLPLRDHGLEWIQSEVPLAHPLDGGRAAVLHRSVDETADGLGADAKAYRRLFGPFVEAGLRPDRRVAVAADAAAEASRSRWPATEPSVCCRRTPWLAGASTPTRRRPCSPGSPATRSSA